MSLTLEEMIEIIMINEEIIEMDSNTYNGCTMNTFADA